MVAKLIAVNVGLPRNVAWNGRTVYTGVWKAPVDGPRMGTRIPALTRQNAGLSAVSFRLIPIQYRSLPADSLQPESLLVQKPRNTPQAPTGFYGATRTRRINTTIDPPGATGGTATASTAVC